MKKLLGYAFIGAIVGFVASYMNASGKLETGWSIDKFAQPLTIIFALITTILLILFVVYVTQIKHRAKTSVIGEEEDQLEEWVYKKFSDVTLVSTVSIILALTTGSMAIITDQSMWLMIIALLLIIFSALTLFVFSSLIQVVYKDRNMPNTTDKDYSKKLLETSDEGERHVMLEGLYRTFQLMNVLLPFSIIVLFFYSEFSGESQLFAIFLVAILTIILNTRYLLKIRSMY